ncbi:T9SS type A sorting domain-containing protein [Aureisphaera galaxeae]|uniref:T9SS type A sorting domain-containing protein n=1 Tax=Aureisphaera galaxeae TaxID=1538023 RepID=UPI002350EB6F|nr:T9SS type A sorting domain-containing protein [Aureisphaera galaxeae]MDC8005960.1 T9SS type A sorting domain-containing protein [Aureisphaera galaxeae]
MKKLLLLFMVGMLVPHCYAQDQELFGTWYLYEVLLDDLDFHYVVSEINPPITPPPIMTINESLEIHAVGACNTYDGTYNYILDNTLAIITSTQTDADCGIPYHNSFENAYFNYLLQAELYYTIESDGQGLTLYFENPLMGFMILKNYPLSANDYTLNSSITLHPNPASDHLNVLLPNTTIEKLSVFNISGQRLIEQTGESTSLDVSALPSGMYFLEILTPEGKALKRFLK